MIKQTLEEVVEEAIVKLYQEWEPISRHDEEGYLIVNSTPTKQAIAQAAIKAISGYDTSSSNGRTLDFESGDASRVTSW